MKALLCELCGSNDFVKQDGFFVCQHCGTKYTLEEARKIMLEGSVDVSGSTVKIDNSEDLANLYLLARRAKNDNNNKDAAKYYEMIVMKDPNSWEASLYSMCCKALVCGLEELEENSSTVLNSVNTVFGLLYQSQTSKEDYLMKVRETENAFSLVSSYIYDSSMKEIDSLRRKGYKPNGIAVQKYGRACYYAKDIMYYLGDNTEKSLPDYPELLNDVLFSWNKGIEMNKKVRLKDVGVFEKVDLITEYSNKVNYYIHPENPSDNEKKDSGDKNNRNSDSNWFKKLFNG